MSYRIWSQRRTGIRKLIAKVRETGFIVDASRRAYIERTPENIEAAAERVHENIPS